MRASQALGEYGERLAAAVLADAGFTVLERNWRCRWGEIDLVADDAGTLVVCEVKTRSSEAFGSPLAAVTPAKARRLRRLAGCWLQEHPGRYAGVRIDVVAILRARRGPSQVEHLRGVA